MNKYKKFLLYIRALPKTVLFNFKYFKIKEAFKFPILVSHRVWLLSSKGEISINSNQIKTGMIKIGFGGVGIFDQHKSRSIWEVSGKVIFNGECNIGHGSKISVSKGSILQLGRNLTITAETSIVCQKEITIGDNCLISWDTLLMDSDFHKIKNLKGNIINENLPIIIGDNVWIGCRNLILKGSKIPNNTIIASNSTITKSFSEENSIIGGNPCKVIKQGITWEP
jgi:acetyltransferase-like isoleucine patch superfamily enzyme